jgi:hypothetical protein
MGRKRRPDPPPSGVWSKFEGFRRKNAFSDGIPIRLRKNKNERDFPAIAGIHPRAGIRTPCGAKNPRNNQPALAGLVKKRRDFSRRDACNPEREENH